MSCQAESPLPSLRPAALFLLLCLVPPGIGGCSDPCAGQGDGCLAVTFTGRPQLDTIQFDVRGALMTRYGWRSPTVTQPPLTIPVPLGKIESGPLTVRTVALLGGKTVALGQTQADLSGASTGRADILLSQVDGPTCSDGYADGDEADIDCGGSCLARCADGQFCNGAGDCGKSSLCQGALCTPISCTDGIKNGKETDVDCGGSCGKCQDGQMCLAPSDCQSGACLLNVCQVLPQLFAVSPRSGPTTGGITLTLDGDNFPLGKTVVLVNNARASNVVRVSPTRITAQLPSQPGVVGPVDVTIANESGAQVTQKGAFRYYFGTLRFAPQLPTSVTGLSVTMATGILDTSGYTSVAAAGYYDDNAATQISVLSGRNDGTLKEAQNHTVGTRPAAITSADVNKDGSADLLVANLYSANVSVLLGDGMGGFKPAVNFPTGSGPRSLVAADMDGDGNTDLVTGNAFDGTVSVLLGDGQGGFAAPLSARAFGDPQVIAVGDLNGDGKLDVVAANFGPHFVLVLLGHGDGTFEPAVGYQTDPGPIFVAIADLNGDGRPDVAVATTSQGAGTGSVELLPGKGDGTLDTARRFPTSGVGSYDTLAVGDLNRDGKQDLVAVSQVYNTLTVFLGSQNGDLGPGVNYLTTLSGPYGVAIADFNSDGTPDIVINNATPRNVTVYLNQAR